MVQVIIEGFSHQARLIFRTGRAYLRADQSYFRTGRTYFRADQAYFRTGRAYFRADRGFFLEEARLILTGGKD